MKKSDKQKKDENDSDKSTIDEKVTFRGSGFTYTENEERTDKSVPQSEVKNEEVVNLPDLGQKNRP
jgi:hypothetical protein